MIQLAYSPLMSLSIFIVGIILLYFLFRPKNGLIWVLQTGIKQNEKTVIEDVLKQLYHAESADKLVDISTLSGVLNTSDGSILDAVKIMESQGLISTNGKIINLNDEGRDYALRIVRVHRLWEKYLAEKTGYHKSEWHGRAEQMEHKLDEDATNNLAIQLGNPSHDPHGDPIPTDAGLVSNLEGIALSTLPVNSIARIVHIEDEPDVIYKQIVAEKIHVGSQLRVIENNSERIVFHAEGEKFTLAPIVAANIAVLALEKEEEIIEDAVRLTNLRENEKAKIVSISKECRGEARRRLLDLGFVKGSDIKIDMISPLKNPISYKIKGTSIALRNDQASHILIQKV